MTEKSLPEWLVLWIWRALLGEIYPEVRAIAVRFTDEKELTIRYYLDREPTEDDYESIGCIITDVFSNTSSKNEISAIHQEARYSQTRIGNLDILDGLIYARRELEK
jgi:hypothetical protein